MSIRINDIEICAACVNKICTYSNSTIRENFHGLRSETTVCPVTLLQDGPLDIAEDGKIDKDECINCGLCELSCSFYNNLTCIIPDYLSEDFEGLSDLQYNAIACSYLHYLVGFSANTNRNRALQFDGYVAHASGQEAFVEIDYKGDSLECVRRILGDNLLYSPFNREIKTGVVIFKEMPRRGTRDVYNLLEMMKEFPYTKDIKIYVTTFSMLRLLALNIQHGGLELGEALFDIMNETVEQYLNRISSYIQDEETMAQLKVMVSLS